MRCELLNAPAVRDIQGVESDFGESTVRFKSFGLLQLRILLEFCYRSFSPALIPRCKINEKRSVLKRRLGILEGELAHNGETDALVVLVDTLDQSGVD